MHLTGKLALHNFWPCNTLSVDSADGRHVVLHGVGGSVRCAWMLAMQWDDWLLVCCLWTSLLHREGDWGLQENDTFASSSTPQINFTSPPIATVQLSFIYDQIFSIVLTSGLEFRTFYGQSPVSQLALSLHGMWSGFPYYFPWNTAFWRGTWLSLFLFVTSVCSGGQLVVKWNQQYIGDSDPKCCALVNISCALVCMW